MTPRLTIIGAPTCGQCKMLKKLLDNKKVPYTYKESTDATEIVQDAISAGYRSLPICVLNGAFKTKEEIIALLMQQNL